MKYRAPWERAGRKIHPKEIKKGVDWEGRV
jgi:hypothetical protein